MKLYLVTLFTADAVPVLELSHVCDKVDAISVRKHKIH